MGFESPLMQILPPGSSIFGRLNSDLPLGCLQGSWAHRSRGPDLDAPLSNAPPPSILPCSRPLFMSESGLLQLTSLCHWSKRIFPVWVVCRFGSVHSLGEYETREGCSQEWDSG